MNDKPLSGIVVCDFGQHGAGSSCGKNLADWGATVIKVEPFRGCGSRAAGRGLGLNIDPSENIHHEMINSGKRGIAVDVKTQEGAAIIDRLLTRSHIFFSNYRLGSLKKLGLDYETLSAKYPRLICGYLTAYGPEGPKANDPGFDSAAYWAYSGMTLDCGTEEDGPIITPFGGGDMVTGLTMAAGLAACLYKQAVTGKGESVYTSLYGTGCWQASCMIQAAAAGAITYPHSKKKLGIPTSGNFRSQDGEWFNAAVMDYKRQGPLIAKMVGRDDLQEVFSSPADMEQNREEYMEIMRSFYSERTWEEIDRLLTEIDVVHSRLQKAKDVYTDPQALQNHYIYDITTRNGKTAPIVSTPVQFGDRKPLPFKSAPLIGEHTREILAELDFSQEEIETFFENKAVMETKL